MRLLISRKIPWEPTVIAIAGLLCLAALADPIYGDGWGYYANLESMIDDGDLKLINNRHGTANGIHYYKKSARWACVFPFGTAWLQAPFFSVGKVLANHLQWESDHYPLGAASSDQFWRLLAILTANSLYALTGMLIIFSTLLKLGFRRITSLMATLTASFCSPLPYYGSSFYSHSINFFLICLAFLIMVRILTADSDTNSPVGKKRWLFFLLGAVLCLATHVRYGSGFIFAAVFTFFAFQAFRRRNSTYLFWLLGGYLSLFWLFPVLWKIQFGSFFDLGYQSAFVWRDWPPPVIDTLVGSHHGFLLWYPIHFLSIIGLWWMLRSRIPQGDFLKQTAAVSLMAIIAVAFIYGLRLKGDNPGDYSIRTLTCIIPFLSPGLATFFHKVSKKWSIGLTVPTILFSAALLFLSRGQMVKPHPELGNHTGNYLSDYLYVFQNQIPLKEILAAGLENSYFLPHVGHYPIYFFLLLGFLFIFVIFSTNLNTTIMKRNRHDIG
jgi:hypothetical protein